MSTLFYQLAFYQLAKIIPKLNKKYLEVIRLDAYTGRIILIEIRERVNEDVRVYFCPGSGEKMGHFRKTGAKAM